ncbi:MAG: hypothetical protein IJO70_06480 [Lachnospiraceae bacterium]|nr:hypothetical protein [Lachnospiraceae bacterium]
MWRYWDWNEISRKYVKHYSRILFLILITFLMMSIPSRESFAALSVYNFTSKRPELVLVYQTIIIPAFPYLKKALLLCLIIIPILIIISWKPDTNNSRFYNILYNFTLVLFGLIISSYMLAVLFFLKSTCIWFIFFVTVLLLIIATLIISHLYYKKNKEKFNSLTGGNNIILSCIIISSLVLEIFLAYPKVIESKKALHEDYKRVCHNITYNSYFDIFAENYEPSSKYFKDLRTELDNGSKTYVILNFINLYSTEKNDFTAEEIIECYNILENTNLKLGSDSWYALEELYDADKSAMKNTKHLSKYNLYRSPLGSGYTAKHVFYENVHRRLNELGYTTTTQVENVDKKIVDDACKYVYDIFESGLYEPIKEVNLSAEYIDGEYVLTPEDGSTYFVGSCFTRNEKGYIHVFLYHSVGYYFDKNTIINIEGLDAYNISDIEFEYEPSQKDEYKYADMEFDISIK